jgi:hypothetical protein
MGLYYHCRSRLLCKMNIICSQLTFIISLYQGLIIIQIRLCSCTVLSLVRHMGCIAARYLCLLVQHNLWSCCTLTCLSLGRYLYYNRLTALPSNVFANQRALTQLWVRMLHWLLCCCVVIIILLRCSSRVKHRKLLHVWHHTLSRNNMMQSVFSLHEQIHSYTALCCVNCHIWLHVHTCILGQYTYIFLIVFIIACICIHICTVMYMHVLRVHA